MIEKKILWPRIFLFIAIFIFALLKLPALHLPYFWDELGVYARAGLFLKDNRISLLPSALPPELSRGHPLLFPVITATGFKIFGDGVITGHSVALIISISLLLSVYYITAKKYSQITGLLAVIFIIVQPLFFAQSVMILPEITLALFILWALYFWSEKRFLLYALFSSLAILIKETAVIVPFVVLVFEAIEYFVNRKRPIKTSFNFRKLFVISPLLIFTIFLFIQKAENGWYLFPLHKDNIGFDPKRIFFFGRDFCRFLFIEQGRIVMTVVSLLILLFYIISKKLIYNRFSVLMILLVIGGIAFSSLNFFMNRYMIFVLIPSIILFSSLLLQWCDQQKAALILIPVIISTSLITLNGKELIRTENNSMSFEQKFDYDENMSYATYLAAQQEATDYVLSNTDPDDRIFSNFPLVYAFDDTRFGFTDKKRGVDFQVENMSHHQTGFDFALIANPGSYNHELPAADSLIVAKTIENNIVNIIIYTPRFSEKE